MEIEQLRVKITAETASIRAALKEIAAGLKNADATAKKTQQMLNQMNNSAANTMKSVGKATDKTQEKMAGMVNGVKEVIGKFGDMKEAMRGFSDKKVFKLDFAEVKQDLKDTEQQIKELYQELDQKQAKMHTMTNPAEISEMLQEIGLINGELDAAERHARELKASLILGGDGVANTTKDLENLKLKLLEVKEARDKAMNDLGNMNNDIDSEQTQQQIRLVGQLSDEYNELEGEASAANAEMSEGAGAEEAMGFWGKLAVVLKGVAKVLKVVAHYALQAAKAVGKAMLKLPAFTAKMGKFMVNMTGLPKLFSKVGSAIRTLFSKIKTAFIFSAINQAFRNMREQVEKYMSVHQGLQSALRASRGAWLTAFQPIWETIIPMLITLLNLLTKIGYAIASFTARLTGKSVAQNQAAAKALNEEANAIEGVGGAAAEASKYLASFDELNVLPDDKGGGGGGGLEEATVDFGEIPDIQKFNSWGEAFSALLDKLLAKLPSLEEWLGKVADKINEFSKNLLEMLHFDGVQEKVAALASGLAEAINHFYEDVDWVQLGQSIGAAIDTLINFIYNYIKSRDWKLVGRSIAEALNGLFSEIDWHRLGETLTRGFSAVWQILAGFLTTLDWAALGQDIWDFIVGAIEGVDFAAIAEAIGAAIGGVIKLALTFLGNIWGYVKDYFAQKTEECGGNAVLGFFKGIKDAFKGIKNWIKTNIIDPFLSGFRQAFGISGNNSTIMEEEGKKVSGGFFKGFKEGWEKFADWCDRVFKVFINLCKATWESILKTAKEVWTKTKDTVTKLVETLKDTVEKRWKELKKNVEDTLEKHKKAILDLWEDLKKKFTTITEDLKKKVEELWDNLKQNTVNTITNLKTNLETLWENLKQTITTQTQNLKQTLETLWDNMKTALSNTTSNLKTFITNTWDNLKTAVSNTNTNLQNLLNSSWNTIRTNLSNIAENIKTAITNAWNGLRNNISNILETIRNNASNIWNNIKSTLTTIADNIRNAVSTAFENIKEAVINAFYGIQGGLKAPINGIIGFINQMIAGVVQGINNMVAVLNSLSFDVPDWVPLIGGQTFSLNVGYLWTPQIPLLAKGGVIKSPTLAMMGEYAGANNNPEIAAPQSVLRETMEESNDEIIDVMIALTKQLITAIGDVDMEVVIGDDTIANSVKRSNMASIHRTGKPLLAV